MLGKLFNGGLDMTECSSIPTFQVCLGGGEFGIKAVQGITTYIGSVPSISNDVHHCRTSDPH